MLCRRFTEDSPETLGVDEACILTTAATVVKTDGGAGSCCKRDTAGSLAYGVDFSVEHDMFQGPRDIVRGLVEALSVGASDCGRHVGVPLVQGRTAHFVTGKCVTRTLDMFVHSELTCMVDI